MGRLGPVGTSGGIAAALVAFVLGFGSPAGAEPLCRPDPCTPTPEERVVSVEAAGVLDAADAREPLAVAGVSGGLAVVGFTLSAVVWRRRKVLLPALAARPVATGQVWQPATPEVGFPEP